MSNDFVPRYTRSGGKIYEIGALRHLDGHFWIKEGDYEKREEALYVARRIRSQMNVRIASRIEKRKGRFYVWYRPKGTRGDRID